jgi:hypothetical protein
MKMRLTQILGLAAVLVAPAAWAAAPTILCSSNQVLEATSTNGAAGVVEATVQDVDGDNLMVVWALNGIATVTNVIDSASSSNGITLSFTNEFGFGTNDVSVGVTDDGTNVVMCSTTVVVADTTPPEIESIVATPSIIWPPNHKLKCVRLVVKTTDIEPVTWRVTEVESNEAEDITGSGNTSPDWVIQGDHKVSVRAERSGHGNGRIYKIFVEASDAAGNSTAGTVRVLVPHDRRHPCWEDDGSGDDDDDQGDVSDKGGKGKKGKGKEKAKGKKGKKK